MRTSALLVCFVLLIAGWTSPGTALPVEELLPADTDLVFLIEDVPAFLEEWEASPWARVWGDPGFAPMFDAFKDDVTGEARWNQSDPSLRSILEAVRGQAALVAPDLSLLMNEEDETEGPWALIGEFSIANSGIQEILDREMEGEDGERDVEGTRVRFRITNEDGVEKEALAWAQVGETAVLGQSSSFVAELVHGLTGGAPEAALAGVAEFQTMKKRNPDADVYMYFSFTNITGVLREEMETGMAENPQATMMGISGSRVSEALALDAFRAFYTSYKQSPGEITFDFGLHYTPGRGLAAVLGNYQGTAPRPEFIPETALMASTARYDYARAWDALLDMMDAINPDVSGMLQAQLGQVSMNLGMDLEQDVIRNLGDEAFSAYLPAGESVDADQVFGITIRDPKRLEGAIDAVLESMGPDAEVVGTRKLEGVTVYDVTGPGAETGQSFSLSVHQGHLLVGMGTADALAPLIRGMKNPGPSIWKRKDLVPLFSRLPADASAITYSDFGAAMQTAVGYQLDHLKEEDPDDPSVETMSEVDWDRLSRYFGPMVAATVQTDQGMFGKGHLILLEP